MHVTMNINFVCNSGRGYLLIHVIDTVAIPELIAQA